jgi:hypothetical protein
MGNSAVTETEEASPDITRVRMTENPNQEPKKISAEEINQTSVKTKTKNSLNFRANHSLALK